MGFWDKFKRQKEIKMTLTSNYRGEPVDVMFNKASLSMENICNRTQELRIKKSEKDNANYLLPHEETLTDVYEGDYIKAIDLVNKERSEEDQLTLHIKPANYDNMIVYNGGGGRGSYSPRVYSVITKNGEQKKWGEEHVRFKENFKGAAIGYLSENHPSTWTIEKRVLQTVDEIKAALKENVTDLHSKSGKAKYENLRKHAVNQLVATCPG